MISWYLKYFQSIYWLIFKYVYTIQVNILVIRNKTINGDLDMQMSQKLKNKFKELIRPNIQKEDLLNQILKVLKARIFWCVIVIVNIV